MPGVELRYGNATTSLNWTHLFSNRVFSTFTGTYSRYDSNPIFTIAATRFDRPLTLTDVSLKGDLEVAAGESHRLRGGFWAGNFNLRLSRSFNDETNFRARIQAPYVQAYAQDRWTPSPQVSIDGGLRASYFRDGHYLRLEPRINAEWRPVQRLRLQAGYGRYNQFLTLISTEIFTGADLWLTAADGVPPSFGDQFVSGIKFDIAPRLRLDVEGYYRTMRDLFELDPYIQDPAGLSYAENFRFGDGYATGIETLLEGSVGRLQGFLGLHVEHHAAALPERAARRRDAAVLRAEVRPHERPQPRPLVPARARVEGDARVRLRHRAGVLVGGGVVSGVSGAVPVVAVVRRRRQLPGRAAARVPPPRPRHHQDRAVRLRDGVRVAVAGGERIWPQEPVVLLLPDEARRHGQAHPRQPAPDSAPERGADRQFLIGDGTVGASRSENLFMKSVIPAKAGTQYAQRCT